MTTDSRGPSPWARRLGLGGLIPFVGLAAALWFARPGESSWASQALAGYGAAILSFLGAIHWGLAMGEGRPQPVPQLLWGVAPGLAGWGAMLLGGAAGLTLIAALLWLCYAVDRALYPRSRLEAWLRLRLGLTLVASASCLVAAAAWLR